MLETVQSAGEVEGADGRLVNPGAVLEIGWLLLKYSLITHKKVTGEECSFMFYVSVLCFSWMQIVGILQH